MTITTKYYKVNKSEDEAYWTVKDAKKLLAYNGDVTIAQSPRNYGKSYAGRMLCKEVMDKGGCVAWGRYNKPELDKAMSTWQSFNPELVKTKASSGIQLYEDESTGGRLLGFSWSVSQSVKDTDIPLELIVYDEFIPERYTNKTRLDTEFADWYSVDTSLSRSYEPKKLMIANNIFWFNPFFLKWGIMPFAKGQICRTTNSARLEGLDIGYSRDIVVENIAGTKAIIQRNIKQQSLMFNSDKDLQRYYDNETKQEYTAIGQCPNKAKNLEPLMIMSEGYYLAFRYVDGLLYWVKAKPNYSVDTYVSEPEYIDLERRHWRRMDIAKSFEDAFNNGSCVFDTGDSLLTFLRWIRHMRGRL